MSYLEVCDYLREQGREDILLFDKPSGTVSEAAKAIGVSEDEIAKTLSFYGETDDTTILVVVSGTTKISSGKFKRKFGYKPHMIAFDDVERLTGHPVGGVCPFVNPPGTRIYLDVSLRKYEAVYPACGNDHSAIKVTPEALAEYAHALEWVDLGQ